jgi:hypothetical protein
MFGRARWWVRQWWAERGHEYATALDFARDCEAKIPKTLRHLDGEGVVLTLEEIVAEIGQGSRP